MVVVDGQYSPDGKEIGLLIKEGPKEKSAYRLVVIESATRRLIKKFDVIGALFSVLDQHSLRWTPDGHGLGLTYRLDVGTGGTTNLWVQPISGDKPQQITHFPDFVVAYGWSPDGKRIALTHDTYTSDVVQFSDFR